MTLRQRAAIALTMIGLTTVAACGGGGNGGRVASIKGASDSSSSDGSNSDSSNDQATFEDALLDYSRCMREHGIDMPDPTFGENGGGVAIAVGGTTAGSGGALPDPNSQVFKDAETACKPIMDKAQQSMKKPSPEELAKMRDQALAFARCMRDKGYDMPDPTFDDNGTVKIEVHGGPPPNSDGTSSTNSDTASNGDPGSFKPTPDPKFLEASEQCNQETGGPGIGLSTHIDGEDGGGDN